MCVRAKGGGPRVPISGFDVESPGTGRTTRRTDDMSSHAWSNLSLFSSQAHATHLEPHSSIQPPHLARSSSSAMPGPLPPSRRPPDPPPPHELHAPEDDVEEAFHSLASHMGGRRERRRDHVEVVVVGSPRVPARWKEDEDEDEEDKRGREKDMSPLLGAGVPELLHTHTETSTNRTHQGTQEVEGSLSPSSSMMGSPVREMLLRPVGEASAEQVGGFYVS